MMIASGIRGTSHLAGLNVPLVRVPRLQIDRGRGTVETAHDRLPIPRFRSSSPLARPTGENVYTQHPSDLQVIYL